MPKVQKKAAKPKAAKKTNQKKVYTKESKQAKMIALMKRPEGATIEELIELTGWMRHTIRGTISGTLKRRIGLAIIKASAPRGNVYRIKGGK